MASDLFYPPTDSELKAAKSQESGMFAPPTPEELGSASQKQPGTLERYARDTVNALPAIGGVAGGIMGTPFDAVSGPAGTMVGAGMGGYLGSAAKNAINSYIDPANAPKTTTEAITQPLAEGAGQAAMQGIGEVAAPYISKGLGYLTDKGAEAMADMANAKTELATGATGKQAMKFDANAAPELRKQGIVKAFDSQEQIAKKAGAALDKSGQTIGDTIDNLHNSGVTVDQKDIIDSLRKRALSLEKDPAQYSVSDSLNKLADRMEENIAKGGGESKVSIKDAEETKKGFQSQTNYASSPVDKSHTKEVANVYRQAVEDAAKNANPEAAKVFSDSKKQYKLLSPVVEAAEKRAMTTQQSPHGGMLDTLATGVGAGLGGAGGAIAAPIARRMISSRIPSTMAA